MPLVVLIMIVVCAGIIHGMFISGGPLLIIYAIKKLPRKEEFRVTLSLIWISLNIYLLYSQVSASMFSPIVIKLSLLGLPALILGAIIGNSLAKKMSQQTFLGLTYILLLVSGVTLFL